MQRRLFVLFACLFGPACGAGGGAPDALPPGSPIGSWKVTWTCLVGCVPPSDAPLTYDDEVQVLTGGDAGGEDLRWSSEGCADCTVTDHGSLTGDCIEVPAGTHQGVAHELYTVCGTSEGVNAEITWSGYPGWPDPRTWRAIGKP